MPAGPGMSRTEGVGASNGFFSVTLQSRRLPSPLDPIIDRGRGVRSGNLGSIEGVGSTAGFFTVDVRSRVLDALFPPFVIGGRSPDRANVGDLVLGLSANGFGDPSFVAAYSLRMR